MTFARITSGKRAEDLAVSFLKKEGYKILARNYKTRLGEIDIIGNNKDCICIVEVRSMNTGRFGLPEYTINRKKRNQITKAALSYIKRYGLEERESRFDVVCIEDADSVLPKVRLIKNAFELDSQYRY